MEAYVYLNQVDFFGKLYFGPEEVLASQFLHTLQLRKCISSRMWGVGGLILGSAPYF